MSSIHSAHCERSSCYLFCTAVHRSREKKRECQLFNATLTIHPSISLVLGLGLPPSLLNSLAATRCLTIIHQGNAFLPPPSARIGMNESTRNNECRIPNLSSPCLPGVPYRRQCTPCSASSMDGNADGLALWDRPAMYFPRPQDCAVGGSGGSGSCAGRWWADSLFVPVNCWRSWGGIQSHRQPVPFPWDRSLPAGLGRKLQGKARASCLLSPPTAFKPLKLPNRRLWSCLARRPSSPRLCRCIWCLLSTANGSEVAASYKVQGPQLVHASEPGAQAIFPLNRLATKSRLSLQIMLGRTCWLLENCRQCPI